MPMTLRPANSRSSARPIRHAFGSEHGLDFAAVAIAVDTTAQPHDQRDDPVNLFDFLFSDCFRLRAFVGKETGNSFGKLGSHFFGCCTLTLERSELTFRHWRQA